MKSKTNDFVVGDQEVQKMKFRAKNYEDSQEIDLRNIGVAQDVRMNHNNMENR